MNTEVIMLSESKARNKKTNNCIIPLYKIFGGVRFIEAKVE